VRICQRGEQEGLKRAVHGSLGALAVVCLVYNAVAWCQRHERHLAANVLLYGVLVAFEQRKVRHHRCIKQ